MEGDLSFSLLYIELLESPGPGLQGDHSQCQPRPHVHTLRRLLLHLGVDLVQLDQLQQVSLQLLYRLLLVCNISKNFYLQQQLLHTPQPLELDLWLDLLVLVVVVQAGVGLRLVRRF